MNFQWLKAMIESLIKSYKCPECSSEVDSTSVDIVWAAWNTVNIDIECPSCKKHSMIKAEILAVDFWNLKLSKENMDKLKENFKNTNINVNQKLNHIAKAKKVIKDIEITKLDKDLKTQKLKASDLFDETPKE